MNANVDTISISQQNVRICSLLYCYWRSFLKPASGGGKNRQNKYYDTESTFQERVVML